MYKRARAHSARARRSPRSSITPILYSGPGTAGTGGSAAQFYVWYFPDMSLRRMAFGSSTHSSVR
eukprot:3646195-Alexandrium_andersonii.AAC.1